MEIIICRWNYSTVWSPTWSANNPSYRYPYVSNVSHVYQYNTRRRLSRMAPTLDPVYQRYVSGRLDPFRGPVKINQLHTGYSYMQWK